MVYLDFLSTSCVDVIKKIHIPDKNPIQTIYLDLTFSRSSVRDTNLLLITNSSLLSAKIQHISQFYQWNKHTEHYR